MAIWDVVPVVHDGDRLCTDAGDAIVTSDGDYITFDAGWHRLDLAPDAPPA